MTELRFRRTPRISPQEQDRLRDQQRDAFIQSLQEQRLGEEGVETAIEEALDPTPVFARTVQDARKREFRRFKNPLALSALMHLGVGVTVADYRFERHDGEVFFMDNRDPNSVEAVMHRMDEEARIEKQQKNQGEQEVRAQAEQFTETVIEQYFNPDALEARLQNFIIDEQTITRLDAYRRALHIVRFQPSQEYTPEYIEALVSNEQRMLLAYYDQGLESILSVSHGQWTGDPATDFPLLQQLLFVGDARFFYNEGEAMTSYQRDAAAPGVQLASGRVNCTVNRFVPTLLEDIYAAEKIDSGALDTLGAVHFDGHIETGVWTGNLSGLQDSDVKTFQIFQPEEPVVSGLHAGPEESLGVFLPSNIHFLQEAIVDDLLPQHHVAAMDQWTVDWANQHYADNPLMSTFNEGGRSSSDRLNYYQTSFLGEGAYTNKEIPSTSFPVFHFLDPDAYIKKSEPQTDTKASGPINFNEGDIGTALNSIAQMNLTMSMGTGESVPAVTLPTFIQEPLFFEFLQKNHQQLNNSVEIAAGLISLRPFLLQEQKVSVDRIVDGIRESALRHASPEDFAGQADRYLLFYPYLAQVMFTPDLVAQFYSPEEWQDVQRKSARRMITYVLALEQIIQSFDIEAEVARFAGQYPIVRIDPTIESEYRAAVTMKLQAFEHIFSVSGPNSFFKILEFGPPDFVLEKYLHSLTGEHWDKIMVDFFPILTPEETAVIAGTAAEDRSLQDGAQLFYDIYAGNFLENMTARPKDWMHMFDSVKSMSTQFTDESNPLPFFHAIEPLREQLAPEERAVFDAKVINLFADIDIFPEFKVGTEKAVYQSDVSPLFRSVLQERLVRYTTKIHELESDPNHDESSLQGTLSRYELRYDRERFIMTILSDADRVDFHSFTTHDIINNIRFISLPEVYPHQQEWGEYLRRLYFTSPNQEGRMTLLYTMYQFYVPLSDKNRLLPEDQMRIQALKLPILSKSSVRLYISMQLLRTYYYPEIALADMSDTSDQAVVRMDLLYKEDPHRFFEYLLELTESEQ